MIDPQTLLALSQEIVDALELDVSAREGIAAELATCTNEELMYVAESLSTYYNHVTLTANSVSSQFLSDKNEALENNERADVSNSLLFL